MNPIYKPIKLQGHSRPIKDIKFSNNLPYIFSASADRNVIQWNYNTNEKEFIYKHNASVNFISLNSNTTYMLTGDTTGCIYIWELQSHNSFRQIEFDPTLNIRCIQISSNDEYVNITFANRAKESKSFVCIYNLKELIDESLKENKTPPQEVKKYECQNTSTKYVHSKFLNENKSIVISREDGYLELIDFQTGHIISSDQFHKDIILSFDINEEKGIILTTSKDGYASVINVNTFQLLRQFHPIEPIRNLNAGVISVINNPFYKDNSQKIDVDNLFDFEDNLNVFLEKTLTENKKEPTEEEIKIYGKAKDIIIAVISGGQDSKFVTTTDAKEGGFDILIYNALNGELITSFVDHFGPVNTLAISGNYLASGAEDSLVKIRKIENYIGKNT
ncbi:MAG: hypothetical protein MJ252_30820 [archaeon]|nr:hypothetical protein [archaeon]